MYENHFCYKTITIQYIAVALIGEKMEPKWNKAFSSQNCLMWKLFEAIKLN